VYDPRIGRFVSADPIVQSPTFSQSYNRYAYVFNNPLAYTDPSGFYNLPPNATVYLYNGGEAGGGQNGERSDQIHCDEIASSATCYEFDSYREFRDVIQKPVNELIRRLTTQEAVEASLWVASIGVGITPVGIYADFYTAGTGEDFFTGEEVSGFWRYAVIVPFAGEVRKGLDILDAAKTIHLGRQGKHVPGHNNYIPGRSPLTHRDPQGLLDRFGGKGQAIGRTPIGQPGAKERVDFGEVIGEINGQPTTRGIIHYSKDGAHIVPANP